MRLRLLLSVGLLLVVLMAASARLPLGLPAQLPQPAALVAGD